MEEGLVVMVAFSLALTRKEGKSFVISKLTVG